VNTGYWDNEVLNESNKIRDFRCISFRTGIKMKVAINGFGRIGRAVFRIALENKINVVAVNDVHGVEDAAYLLKYDSVYGRYSGSIKKGKGKLIVDGKDVRILGERDPLKLPWKEMGVDVVIESTGAFRKREEAARHLSAGAKYVIVSAPCKGKADITLVPGVNDGELRKSHEVISLASCTTNCLAPVLKVLDDSFGIKKAMMTTIHSYTSSQALVDGYHKKRRRGRAAALNMIPTTTGATEATCLALPGLTGKLSGLAVRVPTAVGSLIDVVAELKGKFDVKRVNIAFRKAAGGSMKGVLRYTEDEVVSSDIVGDSYSSIVDGLSTMQEGNLVKVLAWYDNEYGYSYRVVDVLKIMKKWVK
jgi:glyceraldehyde 3-phosphate dehydrogenase